jgi:hypothetical protein
MDEADESKQLWVAGGCPYGFVKGLDGECDLRFGGRSCRPG